MGLLVLRQVRIADWIWSGIFAEQGGGRWRAGARQGRQRRCASIPPKGKYNLQAWRTA